VTQTGWRLVAKRAIDRTIAGAALVVASPVIAATAVAVRAGLGSPVLFRQVRPGRHAIPFEVLKFRTMRDANDSNGAPLPDDERLTALGRLLRATSLDELPQLVNVLRGQLSLVGPRPLLVRYLERYSPEQSRRHDVLPGMTGWAQINGRNARTWQDKLALDVWYVDHWSLWLDLKILAATIAAVLRRQGVSSEGHATMPEFMGDTLDPH
jgi:lipopolysaccharide/colanic/teichoic acid biosynthesis glycosyltransferase